MRRLLDRFFTHTNWVLVGIFSLAILQLSPVLSTGYIGDDAGHSLVPGMLRYYDITIFQLIWHDIISWIDFGRFFPLSFVHIYLTFYLLPDLTLYKCFAIGLILLNLLLFHRLIRRVCPYPGLAELSGVLVIMLFQFRVWHDPILAFAGQVQVVFLYLLASFLALCKYLETTKRTWLLVSVFTYLVAMLTYEFTYPMFPLHMLCILRYERDWKQTLKLTLPFVCAATLCIGVCLYLRTLGGRISDPAYQPNLDFAAFSSTFAKQLYAAVPLSYSLTAVPKYLGYGPPLGDSWRVLAIFVAGFALTFWSIWKIAQSGACLVRRHLLYVAAIALSLWLLPGILVCLSPRYQQEIFWGVGHMHVYVEYFGFGLLLASAIAVFASWLALRGKPLWVSTSLLSLLIGAVMAVTANVNHVVVKKWDPSWHYQRQEVEAALRAGLADNVPDGSTLFAVHRYPWWHDSYGAYFYSLNAAKKIHFPGQIHVFGHQIPFVQGGTVENPACLPFNGRSFEVIDRRIDANSSYVLLCELVDSRVLPNGEPASHQTKQGRLHVHYRPAKGEKLDNSFHLVADASTDPQDLKLLWSGKERRLYEFAFGNRAVDARSLRVLPPGANGSGGLASK